MNTFVSLIVWLVKNRGCHQPARCPAGASWSSAELTEKQRRGSAARVPGELRRGFLKTAAWSLSRYRARRGGVMFEGVASQSPVDVAGASGLGAWPLPAVTRARRGGVRSEGRWTCVRTEACPSPGRGGRPAGAGLSFFGPASPQAGQAPSGTLSADD